MSDPLNPTPGLLCKLASVAVHAAEYHSEDGHELDLIALQAVLADAEVKGWIEGMSLLAMAPKRRKA